MTEKSVADPDVAGLIEKMRSVSYDMTLHDRLEAAAALQRQADQLAEVGKDVKRDCWLLRTLGGEGPPVHAFCYSTADVRNALASMIWGAPGDAKTEELDQYMRDFYNPDQWEANGTHWIIRFEIDGVEATLLRHAYAIDAALKEKS